MDEKQLRAMWLHGSSEHTQRNYGRHIDDFRRVIPGPLAQLTLADLQAYERHLLALDLADGSRHAAMAAVKSYLAFATRQGFIERDISTPLRMPAQKDTLNERILEVADIGLLFEAAGGGRNQRIAETFYYCGLRASELCSIDWKDVKPRKEGGQVTVFGKGKKTRTVLIPPELFARLIEFGGTSPAGRVFKIGPRQVCRIISALAKKAGLGKPVSPHWLRHCNASHALEAGCDLAVVQRTLGHANVATTSRYLHARPDKSTGQYLPRFDGAQQSSSK